MNIEMNNRAENKTIRNLFAKHYDRYVLVNHYNDLRTKGRRRVFKTYQTPAIVKAWKAVLKDLQDTVYRNRWTLWQTTGSAGHGMVGIVTFQEQ